jgi:pimeloyl-ACP methyl ester carboxylesterase
VTEAGDYRFFAGWRSDPFFFDTMGALNNLQFTGDDFFTDKDVCSIVLEVPNSAPDFLSHDTDRRALHLLQRGRAERCARRFSCCTDFPPHRGCSSLSSPGFPITITWSRPITRASDTATGRTRKIRVYVRSLAEIMNHFTEALGLSRYTLYMQDYGGPVGFRMALAHPDRIEALIVQDAVAHNEGLGANWKTRRAFWAIALPTKARFAQISCRWRRRGRAMSGTIPTWNAMTRISGPMNLPFSTSPARPTFKATSSTMIESSDLRMTRIPLNHGAGHMPALGFGTLIPDAAVTITATRDALEAGFRHFDCAERYGNEREVGRALRQDLPREGSRAKTFLLPQSCGTPITGPSASNRLSRRVWRDSGSSIWISTSFTLHLHFNPGTTRIRGIKTAMSFTTTT